MEIIHAFVVTDTSQIKLVVKEYVRMLLSEVNRRRNGCKYHESEQCYKIPDSLLEVFI